MLIELSTRIAAFLQSAPVTTLIALFVFLIMLVAFKRTVTTALKIALIWVLFNFVVTIITNYF